MSALGTDFGMGYLYGDGSIPEMPVELYDFLLGLGSFPQRVPLILKNFFPERNF